ncbi:hypothetical protein GLOIN_2v1869068 [Rhizophagus clarus]|uniref:Uncharacterized protein n=1 Tax=Rhizophagus clarus TaxID=94130 RepID=A0A8H3LHV9_9GLOM|nr:hypothetical protein GLOIN_2v1869068 [Rhizophagus clarus]
MDKDSIRGSDDDLKQSTMKDAVQKSTNQLSYMSQNPVIRRRRNIRKLRQITINLYTLISIRRLRSQTTNDPIINQLFNGSSF